MPDPFMTVPEIAQELRYTEATVRNWIRQGKLPAIRATNREYRVRRSDLDAMITTMHADGDAPNDGATARAPSTPTKLDGKTSLLSAQVRLPDER